MIARAARKRFVAVTFVVGTCLLVGLVGCGPDGIKPSGRDGAGQAQSGPGQDGAAVWPGIEREPPPPARKDVWPPKAIWVARSAYRSPEAIADLMDRCCEAGFNTVLFQVRGEATAYYASQIEPWGGDYARVPPNFDPLIVACREAHRRGMALHAWVNVMPAWRGNSPPADRGQLYNARPEWFWHDQQGRRQPLDGFYVSLNPCLPEVRQYLVGVMREIVARYPVDGLHLDYIRFPMDKVPKGTDYPRDKRTVALFKAATGKRPWDSAAVWNRWRADQVTALVREIRNMQRQTRPDILLTAACGASLAEYKGHYFQDGPAWLRGGLIDAAFIMNYATKTETFRKRYEAWARAAGGGMVVPGIGEYLHNEDRLTIEQAKLAKQWGRGLAIFSSGSFFEPGKAKRRGAVRWVMR